MDVRPLTDADARSIATWRYPDRYSTYDVGEVVAAADGFWAVQRDAELIGYCCFGGEARVPGVEEEAGTLDVGYGLRPDLVGHGHGPGFVKAILEFGVDAFAPERLRLLILSWNERSRKVAERLGFAQDGSVESLEGRFLVMRRVAQTTIPVGGAVEIVEYDPGWPDAFLDVAGRLRKTLGARAARIDHIGSTSVPGLASKDVIDAQVSIERGSDLDAVAGELEEAGWTRRPRIYRDHDVPGWPEQAPAPQKRFFQEPRGSRHVNVHVRVLGQPNQRYPLLFRDYLRAHPHSAQAYGTLKRDLALLLEDDPERYPDVKDAACDLIYFAAEDWARAVDWDPGRSDA